MAATTTYFLVICSRNGIQVTFKPTDASSSFIDVTVIDTFLSKSHPVLRRTITYTNVLAFLLKITNLCFKIYNTISNTIIIIYKATVVPPEVNTMKVVLQIMVRYNTIPSTYGIFTCT